MCLDREMVSNVSKHMSSLVTVGGGDERRGMSAARGNGCGPFNGEEGRNWTTKRWNPEHVGHAHGGRRVNEVALSLHNTPSPTRLAPPPTTPNESSNYTDRGHSELWGVW